MVLPAPHGKKLNYPKGLRGSIWTSNLYYPGALVLSLAFDMVAGRVGIRNRRKWAINAGPLMAIDLAPVCGSIATTGMIYISQ